MVLSLLSAMSRIFSILGSAYLLIISNLRIQVIPSYRLFFMANDQDFFLSFHYFSNVFSSENQPHKTLQYNLFYCHDDFLDIEVEAAK